MKPYSAFRAASMRFGDILSPEKRVCCCMERRKGAINMICQIVFMRFVSTQKIAMEILGKFA